MNSLFSAPQPTIAAAVQLHDAVPFNPAAVFQTDAGFVYCRLHTMAADEGAPVMRPLFYDFPADGLCWTAPYQMMLGEDLMIAPVLFEGMTRRSVYLPAGRTWVSLQGEEFAGGVSIDVDAPIGVVPVFYARGSMIEALL